MGICGSCLRLLLDAESDDVWSCIVAGSRVMRSDAPISP
ncbi:unnamed protein product [Heligmosomoides polygyrus]|uniref:Ferredoxin n=1 Tax=Heligmosomoides polygyrus TaxID=6339 RepID=A0A183GC50_HELPZ|nr:unnamed protein product [Heligmosomoides polygyrus]